MTSHRWDTGGRSRATFAHERSQAVLCNAQFALYAVGLFLHLQARCDRTQETLPLFAILTRGEDQACADGWRELGECLVGSVELWLFGGEQAGGAEVDAV